MVTTARIRQKNQSLRLCPVFAGLRRDMGFDQLMTEALLIVIPSAVEESLELSLDALRTAHTTAPPLFRPVELFNA
jgi:hypothetical protein